MGAMFIFHGLRTIRGLYCILQKMQSIFILDAVIPGGTKAQYLQTCSEPVYFMTSF